MPQYWIKVTRDENAKICSLYSPDFEVELLEDVESIDVENDFRAYTKELLLSRLKRLNHVLIPKPYGELKDDHLSPLQHWEFFEVELKNKNKFFSKLLPRVGHVFNVYQIVSGAFITFMALRLASNNDKNSQSSTALSIAGSLFNSIVVFFVYVMSNADNILTNLGHRVDNLCKKNTSRSQVSSRFSWDSHYSKFIALSITAGGCMVANITIASVRQYQEVILLANKYLDLSPDLTPTDRESYLEMIKWLAINGNIIATSYCVLAFQSSFAAELIKKVVNKPNQPRETPAPRQRTLSITDLKEPAADDNSLVSRLNKVSDALTQKQSDPTLTRLLVPTVHGESDQLSGNALLTQMESASDRSTRQSEAQPGLGEDKIKQKNVTGKLALTFS